MNSNETTLDPHSLPNDGAVESAVDSGLSRWASERANRALISRDFRALMSMPNPSLERAAVVNISMLLCPLVTVAAALYAFAGNAVWPLVCALGMLFWHSIAVWMAKHVIVKVLSGGDLGHWQHEHQGFSSMHVAWKPLGTIVTLGFVVPLYVSFAAIIGAAVLFIYSVFKPFVA